jgi:hypothetical protein
VVQDADDRNCEMCKRRKAKLTVGTRTFVVVVVVAVVEC